MRRSAMTMLLLSIGALQPALGGERGPVCRESSVADEIARQVKEQNYYDFIDPKLITEQPTADPHVVHCQVCVQSAPYDTIRFDNHPIAHCIARDFEIHILTSGFVVGGQP